MIKKAKKFTYIIFISLILFLLFNFATWNLYTKDLVSPKINYTSGDLSRLSYYKQANELKPRRIDLPRKHIKMEDYSGEKIDVITIGDSFSSDVTGGLNPYYQDYLATIKNLNVLNVKPYKNEGIINTIIIMKNNGFLDKLKPKALILENVARTVGFILTPEIDFEKYVSLDEFLDYYKNQKVKNDHSSKKMLHFINSANIRCYLLDIMYLFAEKPITSQVYIKNTNKPLFSNFNNKILLIEGDINNLIYANWNNISKANDNLNKISDYISFTGTKLYFMPAVDKYDLYYSFIKDNKHPKPEFFDIIRNLPKNYYLVDTKAMLEKELLNGQKDIFYKDDTHWSYIGREIIAKNIVLAD